MKSVNFTAVFLLALFLCGITNSISQSCSEGKSIFIEWNNAKPVGDIDQDI